MDEANGLMKQSIAYRAKYRAGKGDIPTVLRVHPMHVVPHPRNRNGGPVRSKRTRDLSGTIATDGFCAIEASSNAVAVQEQPVEPGEKRIARDRIPVWQSFQTDFEEKIKMDKDMAAKACGIVAMIASIAKCHGNCVMRNMLSGKKGCECGEKCVCNNGKLVDKNGNYCMERVRAHDKDWAEVCDRGLNFEISVSYTHLKLPTNREV